jgi:BirA family transcriptional regulator, biotin operon repressor / biotin---[acetyl-CoA-carboxylase] ligase
MKSEIEALHEARTWHMPQGVAFEWHERIDSTSSELMRRARVQQLKGTTVIAAGEQSAGRGRMGRVWHSSAGDTLMISLAYASAANTALEGLSLALGVAVAEALNKQMGRAVVQLKWPNDLLMQQNGVYKKLGGLLVETVPINRDVNGALIAERWLIIGLGLNLRLPQHSELAQEAAALESEHAFTLQSAGNLVMSACLDALQSFTREGYPPFQARWQALHAYAGQRVRFVPAEGSALATIEGVALGTDAKGALLIEAQMGENAPMSNARAQIFSLNSTDGQLRLC